MDDLTLPVVLILVATLAATALGCIFGKRATFVLVWIVSALTYGFGPLGVLYSSMQASHLGVAALVVYAFACGVFTGPSLKDIEEDRYNTWHVRFQAGCLVFVLLPVGAIYLAGVLVVLIGAALGFVDGDVIDTRIWWATQLAMVLYFFIACALTFFMHVVHDEREVHATFR